MADQIISGITTGLGINSQSVSSAGTTIFWIVLLIVLLLILAFMIYVILNLLQFKHTYQIKDKTSGVSIVQTDKARIIFDKNGNELKWKLLRLGADVPIPPAWAREQTSKGTYFVRAIRASETGFLYIDPDSSEVKAIGELSETDKGIIGISEVNPEDEKCQTSSEKLTTNTKVFLLDQFRTAELEKPPKTWQQVISEIAIPVAFIMFVVLILVFGKNLVAPVMQANELNQELIVKYTSILDKEDRILARLETLMTGEKTYPAQSQPEQVRPD